MSDRLAERRDSPPAGLRAGQSRSRIPIPGAT
jgi:hypothetical protein